MKKEIGIYIHVPFCASRCHYCDFVTYSGHDNMVEEYINSLCMEILKNAEILSEYKIKSIYIGGGTPSYIDAKYIEQILDTLYLFIQKENINEIEITIEVNPGTLDSDKVKKYKKLNINRISMGVQSVFDDVLKNIGRIHTYEKVLESLKLLKDNSFENISIDLIYPLPGMNKEKLNLMNEKVSYILKEYDIKHISIYNLEVHNSSKLEFLLNEGYLKMPSEDEEELMYNSLTNLLNEHDFKRYEISNYSKNGFNSNHNCIYWNQENYLGFGVNAASFFGGRRYTNIDSIEEYIKGINQNLNILKEEIEFDKLDLMKDYIILKTRLVEGIFLNDFYNRFNTKLTDVFKIELDKLLSKGLIELNSSTLKLSEQGLKFANVVWEEFV